MLLPRSSREIYALKSWRDLSQLQSIRSKSTAHHAKLLDDDSAASAFFYGGSVHKKYQPTANSSSSPHHQNPPTEGRPVVTSHAAQEPPRKNPPHTRLEPKSRARTRSPKSPHSRRQNGSSTRKKKNNVENDNENNNIVRSNESQLYIPTEHDYPDLPSALFTDPKGSLHNAMQQRGHVVSEFSSGASPGTYRCTSTCIFINDGSSETGVGEGPRKVYLARCIDELSNYT